MPPPPGRAYLLVTIAFAAAVGQLGAAVALCLSDRAVLQSAAREPLLRLVPFAVALVLLAFVPSGFRRHPAAGALVLALALAAVGLGLRGDVDLPALLLHGESFLYHLTTLTAFAGLIGLAIAWGRSRELGIQARILAASTGLAAAVLLLSHVTALGEAEPPFVRGTQALGTAVLAIASVVAAALVVRSRAAGRFRWLALLLPIVPAIRLAAGDYDGPTPGSVVPAWRIPLMAAVVIVAIAIQILVRVRLDRITQAIITTASALATALVYVLYRHGYGELEDALDGLLRSLFGFPVPYPQYVSMPETVAVMIAIFAILHTVYATLVSDQARMLGVALGLLAVTGIGLGTAQLALMGGAGYLLLCDLLLRGVGPGPAAATASQPTASLEEVVRASAGLLGLPEPLVLEEARGTVLALRGEIDRTAVDLRVRPLRRGHGLALRVGVPSKGAPELTLVPDSGTRGTRPAHGLGRTHRLGTGTPRGLETVPEAVLDAATAFPSATLRFWPGGAEAELGTALAGLDGASLAELVRALVGAVGVRR